MLCFLLKALVVSVKNRTLQTLNLTIHYPLLTIEGMPCQLTSGNRFCNIKSGIVPDFLIFQNRLNRRGRRGLDFSDH